MLILFNCLWIISEISWDHDKATIEKYHHFNLLTFCVLYTNYWWTYYRRPCHVIDPVVFGRTKMLQNNHQFLMPNFNCKQYTNDKHIIFIKKQFHMNCRIFVPTITWSNICVLPLQHPKKALILTVFAGYLKKKLEN